jgi:hypothetical protein
MATTTFHLRDYLSPGGRYPYDKLAPDMERALAAGNEVSLLSVPGFLMVRGDPSLADEGLKPWTDNRHALLFYPTARMAIRGEGGTRGPGRRKRSRRASSTSGDVRRWRGRSRFRDPQRRFKPPPGARAWEPRSVLAGAYRGKEVEDRPLLTHAVWLDESHEELGEKSVCRRIDIGRLVDPYGMQGDEPVTCPICRERVESSGLPRAKPIRERDPRRARRGRRMRRRLRSRDPQRAKYLPLGAKRNYPLIDVFVDGEYSASTTWAKTLREAKERYAEQTGTSPSRIQARYQRRTREHLGSR